MKLFRISLLLAGCIFCATSARSSHAQDLDCQDVAVLAKMSQARSSAALAQAFPRAGGGYLAESLLAGRTFELHPERMFAIRLLDLIPRNEEQHREWMSLGSSLCGRETWEQRNALSRFRDRLSNDLARASLLVPTLMQNYVAYALVATSDPRDDYAIQMQMVCRLKHETFLTAVGQLPADRRADFVQRIFDPKGCRALALPTAERSTP